MCNLTRHVMTSDPPPPQKLRQRFFAQNSDVDLIAHRGGNGQWPGETAYAFTRALASGADAIDMDVWGTADDPSVLVLMHSSDIRKVTEGSGKVSSLKFKAAKISTLLSGGLLTVDGPFRLRTRNL